MLKSVKAKTTECKSVGNFEDIKVGIIANL